MQLISINGFLLPLPSQPERWISINSHPSYAISSWGRVTNKKGKILKIDTDKSGYNRIKLHRKNLKIHRLVANHFLGWDNKDVNHKDGNKKNNTVQNLEYVTKSVNGKHARQTGLHTGKRLNESLVLQIKTIRIDNLKTLSKMFGVSTRCIQHVRAGTTWSHVGAV